MFTVSFYSYKGGVGRTMALLNVAWYLAQKGSRVALVDLDLEAPGLHHAKLAPSQSDKGANDRWRAPELKGGFKELIELFWKEQDSTSTETQKHSTDELGPDEGKNPTSTEIQKQFTDELGPDGRITLLAAGGDIESATYRDFVQSFSWSNFYRERSGRDFMEELLDYFERCGYDYLLLDARTGLTDVAGITTLHLPDLVVALTNLSNQSVRGICSILSDVQNINDECATPEGSAVRKHGAERIPVDVLLVASPLPTGEYRQTGARVREMEKALASSFPGSPQIEASIKYLPFLSLGEDPQIIYQELSDDLVRSAQLQLLADHDYAQIAEKIISRNPGAIENLTKVGLQLVNIGRWREALPYLLTVSREEKTRNPYGQGFWEASVGRIRAQAQGLSTDRPKEALEDLAKWLNSYPPLTSEPSQGGGCSEHDTQSPSCLTKAIGNAPGTFTISPPERARYLLEGQLALSWSYTLLERFEEAFDVSKKAVGMLEAIMRQHGQDASKDLKPLYAFSLWHTGRTASDAKKEEAGSYYKRAREIYVEVRFRPFERFLCVLDLAHNCLYTDGPRVTDEMLREADSLRAGLPYNNDYLGACYSQRRAQYYLAVGDLQYAWTEFEKAKNGFRSESDGVGIYDVFLEQYRMMAIFGYQCAEAEIDKEAEDVIREAEKMRLTELCGELQFYWNFRLADTVRGKSSKALKLLAEMNLRRWLNGFHIGPVEAYESLRSGKIRDAGTSLSKCSKTKEFCAYDPMTHRFRHYWHLLSGLTLFAQESISEKDISGIWQHYHELKEKQLNMEALQSLAVLSLFRALWDEDWKDALKESMRELTVSEFTRDGSWTGFVYGLSQSKEYQSQIEKLDRKHIFDQLATLTKEE